MCALFYLPAFVRVSLTVASIEGRGFLISLLHLFSWYAISRQQMHPRPCTADVVIADVGKRTFLESFLLCAYFLNNAMAMSVRGSVHFSEARFQGVY